MLNDDYLRTELRSELEQLSFTTAEKDRLTASLEKETSQRTMWKPVLATGAVAAILAGGGVAVAQGGFQSVSNLASELFAGPPASTELLETVGRPIGASDSSDGITITADAVIGDQNTVAILYTLTRDDGSVFDVNDGALGFEHWDHRFSRGGDGQSGWAQFVDEDPTDNAIQFIQQSTVSGDDITNATVTAQFGDLYAIDSDAEDSAVGTTPVSDGSWTLRFELAYPDVSRDFSTGPAGNVDITRLQVSPLTVSAEFVTDHDGPDVFPESPTIAVTLDDGATLEVQADRMSCASNERIQCRATGDFGQLIEPMSVTQISVDGTDFGPTSS